MAKLEVNGRIVFQQRFDNFDDAVASSKAAEKKYHPFAP
jgi:hypothetical protein